MNTIKISRGELSACLDTPYLADSYYRGTRFDHCGIFTALDRGGRPCCGEWFETADPFAHDCVCGPSEEFITAGYEDVPVGDEFMKIGVGRLLKKDDRPYDRFRLYEIADPGKLEIGTSADSVSFRHELDGGYVYDKVISLESDDTMVIRHRLVNRGISPIRTYVYNHNFFTLDRFRIDSRRTIDFNFEPCGHWRAPYDIVALTDSGIRFGGVLDKAAGSVFMGDVHSRSQDGPDGTIAFPMDGFRCRIEDKASGLGVEIMPGSPVEFSVFWSNHRISCIEPYTPLDIEPGGAYEWSTAYRLFSL